MKITIKICSQCEDNFNIENAKYRNFWQLPLCDNCYDKGLKPLGFPKHWIWKKEMLTN